MEFDLNNFNCKQLSSWLKHLGLKSSGNKAELVARLNAVQRDIRGENPPGEVSEEESEVRQDSEYDTDEGGENVNEQPADGAVSGEKQSANRSASAQLELIRRERELLKRERDLLMRENELLKQKAAMNENNAANSTRSDINEGEQVVALSLIKDIIPELNENSNFDIWATQVRDVRDTYGLSEKAMRVIIVGKMKGKVLEWVYSNISGADFSVESLLT